LYVVERRGQGKNNTSEESLSVLALAQLLCQSAGFKLAIRIE
jgi:hypothetical protein